MGFELSPDISFCRTDGGLVFLDLRNDRYFQLGSRESRSFEKMLCGDAEIAELDAFLATGILLRVDGDTVCAPAAAALAPDDIYGLERFRPSLRGVIETGYQVARARRAIRSVRLRATIGDLSCRKAKAAEADDVALAAARHFEANRSLVPVDRRCLIDSVALMRILLARGIAVDLIFGVRTGPFAAHCWLQTRHHILTCAHDEARNFTPILVI
jgi:hypothetical protein